MGIINNLKMHSVKHQFFYISFLIFALIAFLPAISNGQGNLLVFPKRIVLEGDKKSETITLSNTGKDTAKYNISFVQIRMKEDGSFENIMEPDSGQQFAQPYLRFFPRSVTLGPNESQVVKVQLTKTSDLKEGEYRSHMYFRAVPKILPLGEKPPLKDSNAITVKLVPIFGITIAAIIRVGVSSSKVKLNNLAFESRVDSAPLIKMQINRTGNMSVYGDIHVFYISTTGKSTEVGFVQGVAVYTPGKLRRTRVELKRSADINYNKGKLRVTYITQPDAKNVILDEEELILKDTHYPHATNN